MFGSQWYNCLTVGFSSNYAIFHHCINKNNSRTKNHLMWSICQWLLKGWQFCIGTMVSYTNKNTCNNITEICWVTVNSHNPNSSFLNLLFIYYLFVCFCFSHVMLCMQTTDQHLYCLLFICMFLFQPCHVVYTDFRPTPLQHYIFPSGGDGIHLVVDENVSLDSVLYYDLKRKIHVFLTTRNSCNHHCLIFLS